MERNKVEDNCCEIPLNSMPLVGEADYGLSVNPMIHCDRVADFNVMIYLLQGEMEIVEDGISYQLEPGTLFFLKNKVHHWGEKPFFRGTSWYYVHFYTESPGIEMPCFDSNAFMQVQQGRVCLSGDENHSYVRIPKLLHLPPSNHIRVKLEQLIEKHNAGEMLGSSILVWDILEECLNVTEREVSFKEDDRIEAVITFLKENYQKNYSSEELAQTIGFSYKYLGTLFKKSTGKTMKEYQLMLRLNKAENLLCSTRMSMSEIASLTGFYDEFHFSRAFKTKKGVSPLQFRKAYVPRI